MPNDPDGPDAWEIIHRVREWYPRQEGDAPTEEIVQALVDAGLLIA